jgi:glucosylglycerate synthase
LPEESILSDDFIRELINVGEVDIVVGVPTYNDAQTIGRVVQALRTGLLKYFPRARAVIINADGGSRDETRNLVCAASITDSATSDVSALRTLHSISTQYVGPQANGKALHTFLAAADLLQAKACAVVSPESTSLEPEWIDRLLHPILRDNADLVLPVYRRHRFDGLLIKNLVYPLVRAAFGCSVREPYPSDYAFSNTLGTQFLSQDIWTQDQGRDGTELWLTLAAIMGHYRIVQSFLGDRSRPENPPSDLVKAMRETAGIVFCGMDCYPQGWMNVQDPVAAPCIGCQPAVALDPVRVNRKRLYQMFTFGISQLEPVFLSILTPDTYEELKHIAALPEDKFAYPAELWARTVWEFAAAYHRAVIGRDHVVQALVPMFRGRAFTFLAENRESSSEQVEENMEAICRSFENEKPYGMKIWDGGK